MSPRFCLSILSLLVIFLAACGPPPEPPDSVPEEEPPVQAPEPRFDSLVLSFTGDLMAHAPNWRMEDYDRIYAGLGNLLLEDDLSFSNLETPADPDKPYATYPRFNVHRPYVEAAVRAGVDVFSLANNHTNDQGLASSFRTLDTLDAIRRDRTAAGESDLHYSGIRREVGDSMVVTEIELPGWRIGFVSVTHILNDTRGSEATYVVPFWKPEAEETFFRFVAEHSGKYDLFIVAFHGGDEYVLAPPARVQRFLDRTYEAGARIVWGHHPHVMQPWQIRYDFSLGRAVGLVMPSMGNFISGQTWFLGPGQASTQRAYTGDSAVLQVRVLRDRGTSKITINHPKPHWISTQVIGGQTLIRFQDDLVRELSGPWQTFFQVRADAMARLTAHLLYPPAELFLPREGRAGFLP